MGLGLFTRIKKESKKEGVMSLASVKIADYNICLEVNQFSHFVFIWKVVLK